jgi:hypothetical protein
VVVVHDGSGSGGGVVVEADAAVVAAVVLVDMFVVVVVVVIGGGDGGSGSCGGRSGIRGGGWLQRCRSNVYLAVAGELEPCHPPGATVSVPSLSWPAFSRSGC